MLTTTQGVSRVMMMFTGRDLRMVQAPPSMIHHSSVSSQKYACAEGK